MTRQYLDLGSASDWSYRVENFLQPIKSTTQIWGSDTSSVWNFCARFSDVIRGKPVVASRNIGCSLRPGELKSINISFIENSESNKILHDMIYQFD